MRCSAQFKVKILELLLYCAFAYCIFYLSTYTNMSWSGRFHGKNNNELVHFLRDRKIIKSERVIKAMQSVDRGNYVGDGDAYIDAPQGIGYGVTISAPHMHGYALELLEEKLLEGGKALDVGSGSGYLTACFAKLLGNKGVAIGIDHIPELTETALKNIKKDNPHLLESGRVKLIVGDGRLGWAEGGPYNAIHVGAAAQEMPQALIDQLAPGGRMLVPIGAESADQTLVQFDKSKDGKIRRKSLMGVLYVPLTDKDQQSRSCK